MLTALARHRQTRRHRYPAATLLPIQLASSRVVLAPLVLLQGRLVWSAELRRLGGYLGVVNPGVSCALRLTGLAHITAASRCCSGTPNPLYLRLRAESHSRENKVGRARKPPFRRQGRHTHAPSSRPQTAPARPIRWMADAPPVLQVPREPPALSRFRRVKRVSQTARIRLTGGLCPEPEGLVRESARSIGRGGRAGRDGGLHPCHHCLDRLADCGPGETLLGDGLGPLTKLTPAESGVGQHPGQLVDRIQQAHQCSFVSVGDPLSHQTSRRRTRTAASCAESTAGQVVRGKMPRIRSASSLRIPRSARRLNSSFLTP